MIFNIENHILKGYSPKKNEVLSFTYPHVVLKLRLTSVEQKRKYFDMSVFLSIQWTSVVTKTVFFVFQRRLSYTGLKQHWGWVNDDKVNCPFKALTLTHTNDFCWGVGVIFRDSYGVAQVHFVIGHNILNVLKSPDLRSASIYYVPPH